ncbi:MAG: helix-turn-helix domain-containing protein [Hyphomicrobiales bacterium]|nr:helix-turn-helix domain-containing protein [Hyphomicrobiales bacterium]
MHEPGTAATRRTYTMPEAAQILGIGRTAAYEAARTGELPTIRIGKRILVPAAALDRFLSECGQDAANDR